MGGEKNAAPMPDSPRECPHCTYQNTVHHVNCEMCGLPMDPNNQQVPSQVPRDLVRFPYPLGGPYLSEQRQQPSPTNEPQSARYWDDGKIAGLFGNGPGGMVAKENLINHIVTVYTKLGRDPPPNLLDQSMNSLYTILGDLPKLRDIEIEQDDLAVSTCNATYSSSQPTGSCGEKD